MESSDGGQDVTPEQWQRLKLLYAEAEDCVAVERSTILREAELEDPQIGAELRVLLEHRLQTDDFLERPMAQIQCAPAAPNTIGRYRVLRQLGEGGMGAVYEAEQDQPCRAVALKVIKPGFATPELQRRFAVEAESLGRLQHPGIAQIYEAGTADSGLGPQPYFVMELIRGESLLKYAEFHHLDTRQRLEIMTKVCEAVHHAHQRGIIHRDLKPGNILVDRSGQPKVLDFGVARATDSDAQITRQTDVGQIVGTLAYMSPEQVLGDPLELDTRSDVYALGVVLFELLAGHLPYKISRHLHEAVQAIREEDPARLSSVNRKYRGDIETIVSKALEKDKARRYASAAGLAIDIQRYLRHEPIAARPPSTTYQLQKFARRHKTLVAGIAAVLLVLVGGIIAATWEARRAEIEATTAKAVNDFLQNDLLAQASAGNQARPDIKPDPDLRVRTALDRAAARVKGKFEKQPLVEASIRQTVGKTYMDLGLYAQAQQQLERALYVRRRVLGEQHPDTLETMNEVASSYQYQGKYAQAETLFAKAFENYRHVLGEEHADTVISMNNLANLYTDEGKNLPAEPLFARVLEIERRRLGEKHPNTLTATSNLAALYTEEGKYAEAEPLFRKVMDGYRSHLGAEHPSTLIVTNNLAMLYLKQGKYSQAEPLFTKVVDIQQHVLGKEHPDTVTSMNNLAGLYTEEGKYTQAEPLFVEVVTMHQRVLGEQHPDTLHNMKNLAVLYRDQGRYMEAEPLIAKVLKVQQRVLGAEHPDTVISMNELARLYWDERKYAYAEALYIKVLELQRRVLGAEQPRRLSSMTDLAALYLEQGRYTQAEALLHQALNGFERATPNDWDRYRSQSLLGASLAAQGQYAEAERLLLSGYEGMLDREAIMPFADRFNVKKALDRLIYLYQRWGKPDRVAEWQ